MESIQTHVLVIGGGLAGLGAAIEARRAGREVLLLCKMRAGRSGNSVVAACNMSGVFSGTDSAGEFCRDIMAGGQGISDPRLVETMAQGSAAVIPFLEEAGVRFLRREGTLVSSGNPGHATPRTVTTCRSGIPVQTSGLSLSLPLLDAAIAAGVRILDGAMALDLLTLGGEVRGAVALDREGRFLRIESSSVVLACGGGGRLYAASNNTREMTGDGLALAYRAGAELRDLEFIQFHPAMGIDPVRVILPTTLFEDGAVLRNSGGERFLLQEHPMGEVSVTRDAMSRAICREIREGRGLDGGVLLDLSGVAPEAAAGRYRDLWQLLLRHGHDPGRTPLTVGLAVHFLMGGICIDCHGASTLPGLFGAGEVAGGLHGANRLGGNALVEAVVFGRIAGASAASRGGGEGGRAELPPDWPTDLPETGGDDGVEHLITSLRSLLWEKAGVIRTGVELEAGLQELESLREGFSRVRQTPSLRRWFEARNMLLSARLILLSARARRESRGAHFRSDFPLRNDADFLGSFRLVRSGGSGEPQVIFVPVQ